MSTITTQDGTQIYYKDWGEGRPVVFSHGWPLTADAWEYQMLFLASEGYRTIAHDLPRLLGGCSLTMSGTNLTGRHFKPLLKKARLPGFRLQDLRHTCATILLMAGKHPKYVQELLGHASISITLDTYSHVIEAMDEAL
jgi:hypothetical protein